MRDGLEGLVRPRSVALVGITERSSWSANAVDNIRRHAPDLRIVGVNPRHREAFGIANVPSLADLDEPVDLAYIMSPRDTVIQTVSDAGAADVRNAIVLTAGFGEVDDGIADQLRLRDVARECGVNVMGPNTTGLVNMLSPAVVCGLTLPVLPDPGRASFILHSGGMMKPIMNLARSWGIGVGFVGGTGNEVDVTATDIAQTLMELDDAGAIGMFLETVRDPADFIAAAATARERDCPLVVLTVGRSDVARESAVSHTGAMTGDADITEAVLRDLGVVQVYSLEEMVATTGLLSRKVRPAGPRLAVIGASGGVCELTAEAGHANGFELPQPAATTVEQLATLLPAFGHARNPLDITGYVAIDPTLAPRAMEVCAQDLAGYDTLLFQAFMMPTDRPAEPGFVEATLEEVARIAGSVDLPVLLQTEVATSLSDYARQQFRELGLHWLPGVDLGLRALAAARDYQARRVAVAGPRHVAEARRVQVTVERSQWSEAQALAALAAAGVPVVPHVLAASAEDAAAAARQWDGSVALKICSPDIAHKTEVGGVSLNVAAADVGREYDELLRRVRERAATAALDGVLVTPMRSGGVELVAALRADPVWGPVVVVGMGGVWIEVLQDYRIAAAPISARQARTMIESLRSAALLRGFRGSAPVNVAAAAEAVAALSRVPARWDAGAWQWHTIEINPLRVDGQQAEALDALITWRLGHGEDEHRCQ